MGQQAQRLRRIELVLTPQQVVILWLKETQQAGSLEASLRKDPPPREHIRRAVSQTIRAAMKRYPPATIAKAELQAQQEADALYMLVLNANFDVIKSRAYWNLFKVLLIALLFTESKGMRVIGTPELLRSLLLSFAEGTLLDEAVCNWISRERLGGEPVLLLEAASIMECRLKDLEWLCAEFNPIALLNGLECIDLESTRTAILSMADETFAIKSNLARMEMLAIFGEADSLRELMNEILSATLPISPIPSQIEAAKSRSDPAITKCPT